MDYILIKVKSKRFLPLPSCIFNLPALAFSANRLVIASRSPKIPDGRMQAVSIEPGELLSRTS